MSLLYWLPMLGTLENQGLSAAQPVNHGATVSTSGKLGKCYDFSGTAQYIDTGFKESFGTGDFSISVWFKLTDSGSRTYQPIISNKTTGAASVGCAIYYNHSQQKFLWSTADGSGATEVWMAQTYSYSGMLNTWHHIVMVRNSSDAKKGYFYIDGVRYELASVPAIRNVTNTTYNLQIGDIGSHNNANYLWTGSLCDLRIYDMALSPREIKEISKGLVLHYPLNREGFGGDNLLVNTDFSGVSKKFTLNSGSEGGLWFPPTSWDRNTEYTVSCKLRGNANMNLYLISSGGNQALNWVNRENLSPTDYKFFSITFTSRNDRDVSNLYICTRYGTSNSSVGDWFEIAPNSLKFEKGATATPWIPNYTDDLYSTMGLDENIVHDASGFQHNGELVVIGKNLIDKNNVTSGGHINNTGGITNTSGWNYTNYIKVKPSTSYIASSISSGGSGTYFALYDENKTLTRTVLITANQNPTFTTTAAERYVRFSIRSLSNELDTAKLEGGTTVTAYGSEGSIEWETNSPRYTLACNPHSANSTQNARPGTTYIRGDCALTNPNQLTIAFWCYTRSGYRGETGQGAFCTSMATINSDGIGVDYQTTAMNHRDNSIDVNSSDGNSHIRPVIGFIANVWHHYAFTYDGQNARTYRDGVLQDTKSFSTATALGSFNMIVLGLSRAGGVWRRNDNTYSDFRVYSTALSVDDILELYQVGASLANNGVLMAHEFIE